MANHINERASFAKRRKIFKDIWYMSKEAEENYSGTTSKPKVIRTVRWAEAYKKDIVNKKKQRIKKLMTICSKVLRLRDREDFKALTCEQMSIEELNKNPHAGKKLKRKKLKASEQSRLKYKYNRSNDRNSLTDEMRCIADLEAKEDKSGDENLNTTDLNRLASSLSIKGSRRDSMINSITPMKNRNQNKYQTNLMKENKIQFFTKPMIRHLETTRKPLEMHTITINTIEHDKL